MQISVEGLPFADIHLNPSAISCDDCRLFPLSLPYSGKLSREKTFANCGYSRKFSPQNLGVWHLWCCKSEQFTKVFSAKIVYFTNSRMFSSSKVFAAKFGGVVPLVLQKQAIHKSFLRENCIFYHFANVFSLEIFPLYGISLTLSNCVPRHASYCN